MERDGPHLAATGAHARATLFLFLFAAPAFLFFAIGGILEITHPALLSSDDGNPTTDWAKVATVLPGALGYLVGVASVLRRRMPGWVVWAQVPLVLQALGLTGVLWQVRDGPEPSLLAGLGLAMLPLLGTWSMWRTGRIEATRSAVLPETAGW